MHLLYYHSIVKLTAFLLALLLFGATADAQDLPDLGDASQATLSPGDELRFGESIMRQIRSSRGYLDDPEVADYLNQVGFSLVANSPDPGGHFEFFAVRDKSVNAFALPGGFIGVHSGLVLTAQSESELIGVVAHEIAHVTQKHIARMIAVQQKSSLVSLAAIAVAILAARSNAELSQAAIVAAQAAPLQSQLNYSRDHEREADRIGLQIVQKTGYDVHAIPVFFERLQRASQIYEGGAPSYLRTHPLTFERIADVQNRTRDLPYKQVPDSLAFQLIRGRLLALDGTPAEAQLVFRKRVEERKYTNEIAARYGLAVALTRADKIAPADLAAARDQVGWLLAHAPDNPTILALAAELDTRTGNVEAGLQRYRRALNLYPTRKSIMYGYAQALLDDAQASEAVLFLERCVDRIDSDPRLYEFKASAHEALGERLRQHRAQAEALFLRGNLAAAIEQLRLAQASSDGDFYDRSSVDARLREFMKLDAELRRKD